MPRRFYVHRQHIIQSLDSLLYQLHTLSFLLSPSLWIYMCRIIAQFQCSRPRELDSNRSLRFFYVLVVLLNLVGVVKHANYGVADGRALVLDFVGMSYTPSRSQLCFLDFCIIILQLVLATIAYETSLYYEGADHNSFDMLLPESPPPNSLSIPLFQIPHDSEPMLSTPGSSSYPPPRPKTSTPASAIPFVIDLRLRNVWTRLRSPPPPPRPTAMNSILPLPNTTTLALPGMHLLLRASRQMRAGNTAAPPQTTGGREMRIPGAMDSAPPDR